MLGREGSVSMSNQTSASDRRAFPRVNTERSIEIVRPDFSGQEPFSATLLDFSQNGAMVNSKIHVPLGEWIVIRPDRKGPGFGAEVIAIVDHDLTPNEPTAKLACRFPEPVEFSVLRLFM